MAHLNISSPCSAMSLINESSNTLCASFPQTLEMRPELPDDVTDHGFRQSVSDLVLQIISGQSHFLPVTLHLVFRFGLQCFQLRQFAVGFRQFLSFVGQVFKYFLKLIIKLGDALLEFFGIPLCPSSNQWPLS